MAESLAEFFVGASLDRSKFDQQLAGLRSTIVQFAADQAVKSIFDFAEAEKSALRMRSALKAIGGDVEAMSKFAGDMSKMFAVDDEAVQDMVTLAANLGAAREEIPEVVRAAIGLSEVLGTDMKSAIDDVIKAQNGNFGQLQKSIPLLKNAATNEERLAIVMRTAGQGLRQREAAASGLRGALDRMSIAAEEAREAFGGLIAQPVTSWLNDVTDAMESMTAGTEKNIRTQLGLAKAWAVAELNLQNFLGNEDKVRKLTEQADQLEQLIQDSMEREVDAANKAGKSKIDLQNKVIDKVREERKEREKGTRIMDVRDLWRRFQEGDLGPNTFVPPPMPDPASTLKFKGGGKGTKADPMEVKSQYLERMAGYLEQIFGALRVGIPAKFSQ